MKKVGKSWLKKMTEGYFLLSLHRSSQSPLVFKALEHKNSFHGVRCITGYHASEGGGPVCILYKLILSNQVFKVRYGNQNKRSTGRWTGKKNLPQDMFETLSVLLRWSESRLT